VADDLGREAMADRKRWGVGVKYAERTVSTLYAVNLTIPARVTKS